MIIYSQIQLRESNHSFFVISLNETKIKVDHEQLLNTEISQLSLSNAGGVGFFVLDHLNFIIINDFPTSNEDYESLWIEIQNHADCNIICGVIYWHPNSTNLELTNSNNWQNK